MKNDFSVFIQNRTEFEKGNTNGVWLSLPATEEAFQKTKDRLNITEKNLQDIFFNGYAFDKSVYLDIPLEAIRNSSFEQLNILAFQLELLSSKQTRELNAAIKDKIEWQNLEQIIEYINENPRDKEKTNYKSEREK